MDSSPPPPNTQPVSEALDLYSRLRSRPMCFYPQELPGAMLWSPLRSPACNGTSWSELVVCSSCRNGCNLYFLYSPFGNVTCSISQQESFSYFMNLGWFCDLLLQRIWQMRYCASSEPVPKRPCMLPLTFFEL